MTQSDEYKIDDSIYVRCKNNLNFNFFVYVT